MEYPNALAWIVNSLDVSGFANHSVRFINPCLVVIEADKDAQQLSLVFGSNGDTKNPFRDDLQELASTLTILGEDGSVKEFLDLYDKEANPFSLFVYEPEDGYIRFDEMVESALEASQKLNQSLEEIRARYIGEREMFCALAQHGGWHGSRP